MTQEELNEMLEKHKLWINNKEGGKRADLCGADLCGANPSGANLRSANLRSADLRRANLSGADLSNADLRYVNLRDADLSHTKLSHADLHYANLRRVNLNGADLDYSCVPLWCGSLDVHIDDRQAIQLLYHLVCNVLYSKNTSGEVKSILSNEEITALANKFHRISECGEIIKQEGKTDG